VQKKREAEEDGVAEVVLASNPKLWEYSLGWSKPYEGVGDKAEADGTELHRG